MVFDHIMRKHYYFITIGYYYIMSIFEILIETKVKFLGRVDVVRIFVLNGKDIRGIFI